MFVWSSQMSTKPTGKKGKEILDVAVDRQVDRALDARRGHDIAFTYLGRVVPLSYEGSEPMLVTYRLLTPLTSELQSRFALNP